MDGSLPTCSCVYACTHLLLVVLFFIRFSDLHYFYLQGCSITITSLTDFLAFMIGASTVSFCFFISYLVCLFVILNNYKFIDMLN